MFVSYEIKNIKNKLSPLFGLKISKLNNKSDNKSPTIFDLDFKLHKLIECLKMT